MSADASASPGEDPSVSLRNRPRENGAMLHIPLADVPMSLSRMPVPVPYLHNTDIWRGSQHKFRSAVTHSPPQAPMRTHRKWRAKAANMHSTS